jgi:hypothetical protein
VQARLTFVHELEGLGYRLLDTWTYPGKGTQIPFTEGHGVDAHSGFSLALAG